MTLELFLAFLVFALVGSITPGPNNLMVLTSGVNYGFVATLPHMLGIALGFGVMVVAVGLGLGAVFTAVPILHDVLKYLGAAYLLWLAWKIATSGPIHQDGKAAAGRPMSFLQGALFQWVNPKAWVLALGAVATYAPRDGLIVNVLLIAAGFVALALPTTALWALFGVGLRRLLSRPAYLVIFNVAMALLLVLSLYPVLAEHLP